MSPIVKNKSKFFRYFSEKTNENKNVRELEIRPERRVGYLCSVSQIYLSSLSRASRTERNCQPISVNA